MLRGGGRSAGAGGVQEAAAYLVACGVSVGIGPASPARLMPYSTIASVTRVHMMGSPKYGSDWVRSVNQRAPPVVS